MPANEHLVEDILGLWRQLRQAAHPVRRGDITPEQYWLLRHLRRCGPCSIGEVATVLGVTQSAATTACQRLEKAGFATRSRDRDDERVVRVMLTIKGQEQIEQWRQQMRSSLASLLGPLTGAEREELQRLMRKILETTEDAALHTPKL